MYWKICIIFTPFLILPLYLSSNIHSKRKNKEKTHQRILQSTSRIILEAIVWEEKNPKSMLRATQMHTHPLDLGILIAIETTHLSTTKKLHIPSSKGIHTCANYFMNSHQSWNSLLRVRLICFIRRKCWACWYIVIWVIVSLCKSYSLSSFVF